MKLFSLVTIGGIFVFGGSVMQAAPLFTQCPAVGVNTGCQFLITIDAGGGVSVAQDLVAPNNGPYDGIEDTLIGVQNNSSMTIFSLPLSSTLTIFGFDGDGLCLGGGTVPVGCVGGKLNPADTSGYGGPSVTFSGIAANLRSGTVNFSPGIAPGGSAFFGLEEAIQITQITPGPPNGVPEPASLSLMAAGMAGLYMASRRRK